MSYSHLSIIERSKLETLLRLGWSTREIGRELGRHHSTIAREIERGRSGQTYEAQSAQQVYRGRRASSAPVGKFTPELVNELTEKLIQTWSPEQIAEKRRFESKTFVCFKTIYRWKYDGRLAAGDVQVLRHTGKRKKPVETRGRFMVGTPISKRPKEVRKRETFDHWNWIPLFLAVAKAKLV